MARAKATDERELRGEDPESAEAVHQRAVSVLDEVCLLAIPVPTYQALAKIAARRGLTCGQLLQQAIEHALRELE